MSNEEACARTRQLLKLVVSAIGRSAVRTRYQELYGEEPGWGLSQRQIADAIVAREQEMETCTPYARPIG
jgi:hypothetical protein